MRTYGRNVRRAWDGEDYRAPKRQRLDTGFGSNAFSSINGPHHNENATELYDLEDNLERAIRETSVAAMSSSPSRKNSMVFSMHESQEEHDATNTITPPSSPPSALQVTPPNVKVHKPAFSFLEKKQKEKEKAKNKAAKYKTNLQANNASGPAREISEPLSEIHNSRSRAPSHPTPSVQPEPQPKPSLSRSLTQTVLDFGQSLQPVTCTQCQMSYTPSVAEDAQLHTMFHNRHSQGIELGKPFLKSAMKWCYEVPHIPGSVVVVDRKISLPGRRVVQRVLEVVNKELGSVDISETDLWSQKSLDEGETDEHFKKVDRYKVFLHVVDGRCVGVCLAERISKSYRVMASTSSVKLPSIANKASTTDEKEASDDDPATSIPTPTSSSPNLFVPENEAASASGSNSASSADLDLATEPSSAVVGVSRIWTSAKFRRKGIAQNLLECVATQFIYGLEIEKDEVAFSQPTEMGVRLARGWFGAENGWGVYMER